MKYTVNTPNGPVCYDTLESIIAASRNGSLQDSNVLRPDDGTTPVTVRKYLEQSGHQPAQHASPASPHSQPNVTVGRDRSSSGTSFFSVPGDPNVPPLLRAYGILIRGVNGFMIAVALLMLVLAILITGQSPSASAAFAATWISQLVISIILFAVGNQLREGKRDGVHNLATLAVLQMVIGFTIAFRAKEASSTIAIATALGVIIIFGPPILVGYKNWNKLH